MFQWKDSDQRFKSRALRSWLAGLKTNKSDVFLYAFQSWGWWQRGVLPVCPGPSMHTTPWEEALHTLESPPTPWVSQAATPALPGGSRTPSPPPWTSSAPDLGELADQHWLKTGLQRLWAGFTICNRWICQSVYSKQHQKPSMKWLTTSNVCFVSTCSKFEEDKISTGRLLFSKYRVFSKVQGVLTYSDALFSPILFSRWVICPPPVSLQGRAAAYQSCPLLPTSQSPFTELCLDAREVEPASPTETTRGTPEPIKRNRHLGGNHWSLHMPINTPINPWLLRWSKTSSTTVMVTGKHMNMPMLFSLLINRTTFPICTIVTLSSRFKVNVNAVTFSTLLYL